MTYIGAAVRREVSERARNCCEYCRVSRDDRLWPYEVDHIIAEKHGGPTTSDNLSWSCYLCNGYKGSDIGSIDWEGSGRLVPLFNPRQQVWEDHFQLDRAQGFLRPLTPDGRVTVLNSEDHVKARLLLLEANRYPCP